MSEGKQTVKASSHESESHRDVSCHTHTAEDLVVDSANIETEDLKTRELYYQAEISVRVIACTDLV